MGHAKKYRSVVTLLGRSLLLVLLVIALVQLRSGHAKADAPACSTAGSAQNGITVAPSQGQAFYIDTGASPKLDSGYIGYRVTNATGSTQGDLWSEVGSFTGGDLGLANSLDHYQQLSSLTNNSTGASYFLLKASSATTTPQIHHLKVWNGRPDLPTSQLLYECVYTFSAVKETIKAAANKVTDTGYGTTAAIEVSNTSPQVGQTITVSVEGQTGTIGAGAAPDGSIVWLNPAAVSSWPTRALRLTNVTATFERNTNASKAWTVNGDQVTYTNQLLVTNAQNCLKQGANVSTCTGGTGSTSAQYRAFYTFQVVGIPSSSVQAVPVAQIASGTQIKHADTTAAGATINISFSGVSINASLTKSVTSTTGLTTVTCGTSCTVPGGTNGQTYAAVPYRLTASSTSSTQIAVDEFVDQPQSGVIYKPGTAKITDIGRTNVTIDDPSYVSSESSMVPQPLHFVGPFNLSSTTAATLNYTMWVPVGSYTNTAYAKIGDLQIGATSSSMTKVVVTSDGSGTVQVTTTTQPLGVDAATAPATSVTSSGATLNGIVDPNGTTPLTGTFQYSTVPNLATYTTVTATTPASGILSGLNDPTAVAYNLGSLSSNTTYYYRVVAGSVQGDILSFTTNAVLAPPTVSTTSATGITSTGATLNGTINPNLTSVLAIQFIYGTSSTLASGNLTVTLDDGAGANLTASGASSQPFATTVTSLTNGTTYYYKLRACTTSNCSSFVDGSIVNFVAQNPPSNPVLSVTKTDDVTTNLVTPGQTVTYTVTIANAGSITGTTSFADAIPTGMGTPSSFTYTNCGSPSSSYSAPTLTVSSLNITNSNNCIVTYAVTVNSPLNEGTTLTNSVNVAAASQGGNDPAPVSADTLTVDATPNLSTSTKSVSDLDGGSVLPGDTLRYTITVINTGDGQATGVAVTDTVDTDTQNLTNITRTNCGSSTSSSTSTQLNITGVAVQVGTNCVITFDVSVKSPLTVGTALSNTATIGAATEGGVGATPSSTTLFSAAPPSTPNLVVTHTENDADDTVLLNQVVGYTITVENNGGADGTGITANSTVASDVTLSTGSFTYTNCGAPGNTSTSSGLSLNNISVIDGQTCIITYNVTVKNTASNGDTIGSSVDIGPASEGGNDPAAFAATTLTVLVPSTPTGLYFLDGSTNLGCNGITGNGSVRLAWGSVTGTSDYQVSLDGGSATSTSGNAYYDWSMPTVDGVHTFKVKAIDAQSNATAWSTTCQVTLDQTAPTVNAGTDQTTSASFTQSSSSASDGGTGIASYSWTKVSGPGTLTFDDAAALHPQVSADTDGTYIVRLTATDNVGNSASDTFTLVWDSAAPTVNAGSDQTKHTSFVQSDSSASDGGSGITSYTWTKVSGPGTVTFTNSSDLHPSISASGDGTYVLRLTIVDNAGNSASDTLTLIWDTAPPTVDAGSNITEAASFTQSDSSATDGTSGIAGYLWSKVSGPGVITFTNSSDLHPQIAADTDGTYVLRLTAMDNAGNSASDTFTLIWDSSAPIVDAGSDQTKHTSFTQTDSIVNGGTSGLASCSWTKESGPGTVTFTSASDLHPTISASSDGTYLLRLTATNNSGTSSSDTFTLIWDTTPPTVNAGSDQTKSAVFAQSDSSATDGTSGIASYSWSKVSGPGTITFTNATDLHPQVSADIDGTYVLRLAVTDNAANSASDSFTLVWNTSSPPPSPAPDNDGVSDGVEAAAPNSGDANSDDQSDADQNNVTSFVNAITSKYAVLENTSNCQNTDVSQLPMSSLSQADGGYTYPAGLMNFTLNCGTPGMTVHVNQYFYGVTAANLVARKFDSHTNTYETIPNAIITDVTIGGQQAVKISYDIVDGGPLDEDGVVNGVVVDPAGPALAATGSLSDTGFNIAAAALVSMVLLAGSVYIKTRRRASKVYARA